MTEPEPHVPLVYVFERVQRVKIRAASQELAEREASRSDVWDVGAISLIDVLDDGEQG